MQEGGEDVMWYDESSVLVALYFLFIVHVLLFTWCFEKVVHPAS